MQFWRGEDNEILCNICYEAQHLPSVKEVRKTQNVGETKVVVKEGNTFFQSISRGAGLCVGVCVGIVIIIVVLGLLAGMSTTQNQVVEKQGIESPTVAPAAPAPAPEPENPNKNIENGVVGSTYHVKYFDTEYDVTLTKAEIVQSDNAYFDKQYVMAFVEIRNTGSKAGYFSPTIYFLDDEQEKYDHTIAIGLGNEYEKTLDFFKQLPAGTKMSGWAAMEVPKTLNTGYVYFEYSNPFLNDTPQYIKYKVG